jgi:GT2 family glycosyltransferase
MNRLIKRVIELEDTEQVLIMNPDIEFRAGWDEHLSENNGIMGFILVKPGGDQDSPDKFTKVEEVDWVTFGAVAIHKKVVDQVGLMEANDYPHFGSDREYCRKSRESGFSVTCSPSRLTHYYGWATRPYIFREVPRAIWERNAKERADSGVYFPSAGAFTLTEEELERRIKGA